LFDGWLLSFIFFNDCVLFKQKMSAGVSADETQVILLQDFSRALKRENNPNEVNHLAG
jgi:hypothetical protein